MKEEFRWHDTESNSEYRFHPVKRWNCKSSGRCLYIYPLVSFRATATQRHLYWSSFIVGDPARAIDPGDVFPCPYPDLYPYSCGICTRHAPCRDPCHARGHDRDHDFRVYHWSLSSSCRAPFHGHVALLSRWSASDCVTATASSGGGDGGAICASALCRACRSDSVIASRNALDSPFSSSSTIDWQPSRLLNWKIKT